MVTRASAYTPTNVETKILKALATAGGGRMTMTELAAKVGASPDTIYNRLQNQGFRDIFIETLRNSLAGEVPQVLRAFIDAAVAGSFQHGKMVLELAGMHKEESTINLNAQIRDGEQPFKDAEQRQEFLSSTLAKLHGSSAATATDKSNSKQANASGDGGGGVD